MYEKDPAMRRNDRADHLNLYNLFGDPCLRIARPSTMTVQTAANVAPGATFDVTGRAEFEGTALVEVVRRKEPPPKLPPGGKKTPEQFRAAYEAANSHGVLKMEIPMKKGPFTVQLKLPADAAPGAAAVRIYLTGKSAAAAGGAEFVIGADAPK
jgi:hypothetical protein